jgi:cellulose biosynthesis protein BcsQ
VIITFAPLPSYGKSHVISFLAMGLSKRGKKVLIIDLDPKLFITSFFVRQRNIYPGINSFQDIDIVSLPFFEYSFSTLNYNILSKMIQDTKINTSNYDFVFIDFKPGVSIVSMNAASFSNFILSTISTAKIKEFREGVQSIFQWMSYFNLDLKYLGNIIIAENKPEELAQQAYLGIIDALKPLPDEKINEVKKRIYPFNGTLDFVNFNTIIPVRRDLNDLKFTDKRKYPPVYRLLNYERTRSIINNLVDEFLNRINMA